MGLFNTYVTHLSKKKQKSVNKCNCVTQTRHLLNRKNQKQRRFENRTADTLSMERRERSAESGAPVPLHSRIAPPPSQLPARATDGRHGGGKERAK